jgi:hydrogenase maturation protein HypF
MADETTRANSIARRHVHVRGIVQGVGFRPFVYNLARRLDLSGFVLNSSSGVFIEAEGPEAGLDQFLRALQHDAPPLARIEDVAVTPVAPTHERGFEIRASLDEPGKLIPISPDVSTCDDCMRDFHTPSNRRYGYPFTNCTNCGPRYTITKKIPYDRPLTTMACFTMCERCLHEYEDPADRRFHAQPNACPDCGPSLALTTSGQPVFDSPHGALKIIREVRRLLRDGQILAIKGLGGFHLACDPQNAGAVRLLRERKKRSDKPFALMVPNVASAERFCLVSEPARAALEGPRRPIVILARRPDATLPADLAPGNNTLGIMLPYTPLHYLLFGDSLDARPEFPALVMTSGNLSEEPIVTSNREAAARLEKIADAFLFHNRDIHTRVDDSVVRIFDSKERVLRRSRGYAPFPIHLEYPLAEILACGAELKNTFCLTKEQHAFLSQHIGDLENYETLVFFQQTLDRMKDLFRIEPIAVAYDLHPTYLSTKFALDLPGVEKIGVQHHHAHIASCMAENDLNEKVIGVAFDGTGYGTDGKIWGGEFLIADYSGFERRAHLRYIPLAGGDTAVREPWRLALSYLLDAFGSETNSLDLPLLQRIPANKLATVRSMIERRINTVDTSACGRLFDAVASIVGVRDEVNFEAQAAIELENMAFAGIDDVYPFDLSEGDPVEIDMRPAIRAIARHALAAKPPGFIAAAFHNTIAALVIELCHRLRNAEGIRSVCLSGGTFQNLYLLDRTVSRLRAADFDVYVHAQVPPNDGGISLGQAVIAARTLSGR